MRKHGGTPSRRDKHVTLAAISPPGVAWGRFVGGQQSGLAGSKPPPLFTRGASSCSSQGRRQGEPWGASTRPSAPTYLPTYLPALWAGCRGPLPTGCGCGGVRAWGPVTNPTARALACCGGGMRVPGGGASCLGVEHPGSGALPTRSARPLGGLPGPNTHWLWVWGGAGVGTRHQPHSARSCVPWGRHEGARRGPFLKR